MAKQMDISANNSEHLYIVSKALASYQRIEILKLLYYNSLNINEISEKLDIPASSAAMHVRLLEAADLINTESQPGIRGSMKLCSRKKDSINISLDALEQKIGEIKSYSMPVGHYIDCQIKPTCGMASKDKYIINEDVPANFYEPIRVLAKIIWSSSGYLEYRFPNITKTAYPKKISVSAELCSEAPNFRDDWKSDITLWINGVDCGSWLSLGDFGSRRGRLNPSWWANGTTQYGYITTWSIDQKQNYINFVKEGYLSIDKLNLNNNDYITVRIGNNLDAKNIGGFTIFGDSFGDYEQNIILTLEY